MLVRELSQSDQDIFEAGAKHWEEEELSWYSFSWRPGDNYSKHIEELDKEKKGIDLPEGRVPHTMLYGFAESTIVGRVSIRHELNQALKERGGNIGYSVASAFRRKGYATELLRAGLKYCHDSLGLNQVLITTNSSNIGSQKVIEKFRVLSKEQKEHQGESLFFYWLDTLTD